MKIKKTTFVFFLTGIIALLSFSSSILHATPVEDKVAVLITSWGAPAGFNFEYAWNSHSEHRIGDRTTYPGEPCKIGHVGDFPFQSHVGILPWSLTCSWPGWDFVYDSSGIYQLVDDIYVPMDPSLPSLTSDLIPAKTPIIPVVEDTNPMTEELMYPPDPRDGKDHLEGWYKIGNTESPFPNGSGDIYESAPLTFMRWSRIMGGPTEPPDAYLEDILARTILDRTLKKLTIAFRNKIDVRIGYYGTIAGYAKHMRDVAEDFANEGFRKMLIARETTDNNNYANEFLSGNYVKERLCELGVLDAMEIYQTRQVGRTPEFNAMNVINLKKFIEAYPEGSRLCMIYVTRGRSLFATTSSSFMSSQFPQSKEVFHENAFLNYLSWKRAIEKAYGSRYDLVFTKKDVESDFLPDNFYSYGLSTGDQLGDWFKSIRDSIQLAKEESLDKIIIVPAHWFYDNVEDAVDMRELNDLPISPTEDMQTGVYELTYCENSEGNSMPCESEDSVAQITICPAYGNLTEEFATAYYVVLQGTLERFGLYPWWVFIQNKASKLITKLSGGTVEATDFAIGGAKIVIPADPYPDRPESFTPETVIPPGDPSNTNNCLWEDTVITIGQRSNPPLMKRGQPIGPAVHFGPYRNIFNRDVTITIPYSMFQQVNNAEEVKVYIYNHVTNDWDDIEPENVDLEKRLVTFKTQVLGLFRVGMR